MGKINKPNKVKLFCGIISSGNDITSSAFKILQKKFGKIDIESEVVNFDYTQYYNDEMGNSLKRFWISFDKLILTSELAKIKVFTNKVEEKFSEDKKRKINIDPGYISPANVILASTKDFSHRIYLDKGIYGEVTTIYKKSDFIKLPWSYPDYMSKTAKDFLLQARTKLMSQLKHKG